MKKLSDIERKTHFDLVLRYSKYENRTSRSGKWYGAILYIKWTVTSFKKGPYTIWSVYFETFCQEM